MARAPPPTTRATAGRAARGAQPGARPAGDGQGPPGTDSTVTQSRASAGGSTIASSGSSARREGEEAGGRRVPGVRQGVRIDAELHARVGAQRVPLRQLLGRFTGHVAGESACREEVGELVQPRPPAAPRSSRRSTARAARSSRAAWRPARTPHRHRQGSRRADPPVPPSAAWRVRSWHPRRPRREPAVETMPSLAPRTAARSQFRRTPKARASWGSVRGLVESVPSRG